MQSLHLELGDIKCIHGISGYNLWQKFSSPEASSCIGTFVNYTKTINIVNVKNATTIIIFELMSHNGGKLKSLVHLRHCQFLSEVIAALRPRRVPVIPVMPWLQLAGT